MGVLTSSQTIQDVIDKGENEKKEAQKLEATSVCSKGCNHKRLPKVTNTPYLKQIGIVIDGTGTYRSDSCQNVEVISGRCRFCRNKKRNLRNKHWMELMKPPPEPAEEADTDELLSIQELEQEVIERIDVLNKQGKLECIPNDQKLLDAALLLHNKGQFITNIGNGKVFLVCKCCGEHRVTTRRSSARANVSFCRWKEKRVKMKDKFAFRFGLKANESSKESKSQQSGGAKKGKRQASKAKKAYPKEVTDKKSGSNKGPVKVSPEQEELFESNSSGKANKKRKTNQTTSADDPVSNRCDDISMQRNEAGGEAGKELTIDTVQLM